MIFTLENATLILAGRKTETRRLRHPVEPLPLDGEKVITLWRNGRIRWQAGWSYAVCPGRGKPAVGRIHLREIEHQYLHQIDEAGAQAEGCADRAAFAVLWDSLHKRPGTRWADNPSVWVLRFEHVIVTAD